MMLKIKITSNVVYDICISLLIYSIWAFNEQKFITYPIKIIYIIIFGIYAFKNNKKRRCGFPMWCILMILMSAMAALHAPDSNNSFYYFINVFQVFLIGFVTYEYIDDRSKIDAILNSFVIGGILLFLRLLIMTPLQVWLSWQRVGETIGSNPNDVGNKAAISAIIALCIARQNSGKTKIMYFIMSGFLSVLVLFSGSRKALLAVVVGVILLNTIGLKNKKKIIFSVLFLIIFLIIGYRFIMSNDVLYGTIGRRIDTMMDVFFRGGSEASSIDLREKYISKAWQLIKEHPFFGIGLGSFSYVSGIGVYSHCDYTEVACSYGIVGALIYFMPQFLLPLRFAMIKQKKNEDYLFLILQFVLLLTYITMVMYTSAYIQVLFAMSTSYYELRSFEDCR